MKHKWVVIVLGLALLTISATPQQDVIRLENRVNQLETRLYSIESTIRTLEQQFRIGGANQRGLSQEDVARLRAEIQTLQLRLADDECALARLDERTLSPAMRASRQKSAGRTDACRANPDAPLRLPDRE
jgi:predicted  nucleic acid-binding Zn-ribbon protein